MTAVSLNIMWPYFEQKSFPLRERAYMEKLEGVCALLDLLNSTKRVREVRHGFRKSASGCANNRPATTCIRGWARQWEVERNDLGDDLAFALEP